MTTDNNTNREFLENMSGDELWGMNSVIFWRTCLESTPHHILQMDSNFTNPHHILQMDSNFTNPHHILQGHSNFTNPHQYITNGFKFHQSTYIKLAFSLLYGHWLFLDGRFASMVFYHLPTKSWGLYGMSSDGISSNWLYSSSSTTFSTPTILLFPGITTYQFFFARSGT